MTSGRMSFSCFIKKESKPISTIRIISKVEGTTEIIIANIIDIMIIRWLFKVN